MADLVMETVEVMRSLPLCSLDKEWVEKCWEEHFLEIPPLSRVAEDDLLWSDVCLDNLQHVSDIAKQWQDATPDGVGLWAVLLENDVSHKALIALIAYLISIETNNSDSERMKASLVAGATYLNLVCVPGKSDGKSRRWMSQSKRKVAARNRPAGYPQVSVPQSSAGSDVDIGGDDGDDAEGVLLSGQLRGLNAVHITLLSDLVAMLSRFSLKESFAITEQVIKALAALTRTDNSTFDGRFPVSASDRRDKRAGGGVGSGGVTGLAFAGMLNVCRPLHGDVTQITTCCCKHFLPNIVMMVKGNKVCTSPSLPHHLLLGRTHSVLFVRHMLKTIGEPCLISVTILVQHICMQVPDRAEYRAKAVQSVLEILAEFQDSQYVFMLKWVRSLCSNTKASVRVFGVEVLVGFLLMAERKFAGLLPVDASPASPTVIFRHIVDRCSDAAASVRVRALTGLAQCFEADSDDLNNVIRSVMSSLCDQTPAASPPSSNNGLDIHRASTSGPKSGQSLAVVLRMRVREERVAVRRAALHALNGFIGFVSPDIGQENVDVMCQRCRDRCLSVRRLALWSVTRLLGRFRDSAAIQRAWLTGVLCMVWDQEASVQEKCLEAVQSVILENIVSFERSITKEHKMSWTLLDAVSLPENSELRRHLRKIYRLWQTQKKVKPSLISDILSHVGTESNQAAWAFLADLSASGVKVTVKPVIDYWLREHLHVTGESGGGIWENILSIIGSNAESVLPHHRQDLIGDHRVFCEERTACYLYSLGVTSVLCPSLVTKQTAILVQSFVAAPYPPLSTDARCQRQSAGRCLDRQNCQCCTGFLRKQGSVDSESDPSVASDPSGHCHPVRTCSQMKGCRLSDKVRAVAFVTLGKLCLQEKEIAKKCVPAMVRELDISGSDAVRNNIVIVLRDLCVRYSTLVNPYVHRMAACLRDPAPIVRMQTMELLTGLLQEDYLKWKGSLFFRFILTLLDPQPEISSFAEYCLGFHLLKRCPMMMSQHFLESIFVFNDYSKHTVFNKYVQTDQERELFSLKGAGNFSQRWKLYRFMLEHMDDGQRFHLTNRICQEVLGAVVDGVLPYDAECCDLLQDTLSVLSSKEIKLSSLRASKSSDEPMDEAEAAQEVIAKAKKMIISQVVKRNVMENTIPIILSLKHMLDKQRSPLLKHLMKFLHELMKDYKDEIADVLASDRQLACEVEYDMRVFESQQSVCSPLHHAPTSGTGSYSTAPPVTDGGAPVIVGARANASPVIGGAHIDAFPVANVQPPVGSGGDVDGLATESELSHSRPSVACSDSLHDSSHVAIEVSGLDKSVCRSPVVVTPATRMAAHRNLERLKSRRHRQSMTNGVMDHGRLSLKADTSSYRPQRAVSTPSGRLSNVTFAGERNVTMMISPPSPITGGHCLDEEATGSLSRHNNEVVMVRGTLTTGRSKVIEKWRIKAKSDEQMERDSLPAMVSSPVLRRSRTRIS